MAVFLLAASVAHAGTYRLTFLTSTTGAGDLRAWPEAAGKGLTGLEAADEICQVRAEAAGFASEGSPVFRAWVSTSVVDAWCHVQGLTGQVADVPACDGGTLVGGGPWVRPDGLPFSGGLDSLLGILENGPLVPASITELWPAAGSDRAAFGEIYATGTFGDGSGQSGNPQANPTHCSDWEATAGFEYLGGLTSSLYSWSAQASGPCTSTGLRLVCFEQGVGPTPPAPRGPGALAFLTSVAGSADLSSWPAAHGESGLAAGDEICRTIAAAGRLPAPESFVAWLSAGAIDARDRLTVDGPWRRTDGYLVADSKSDLLDGALAAPLLRYETGSRSFEYAFTGTAVDGTASGNDCDGWTTSSAASTFELGRGFDSDSSWTATSAPTCDWGEQHLYCFANVVTLFWDGFEGGQTCAWSSRQGAGPC